MPTPNKGIIKILKKRFDVVTVDEFRTSKLYNKDLTQELTNIKIKKGKKNKSIHTLLTLTRNPNGVILNKELKVVRSNDYKKIVKVFKAAGVAYLVGFTGITIFGISKMFKK